MQARSRTTPHGHSILPARPKFSNFTFAVGRITSDHLVSCYFFTPRVMPVSLLPRVYFKNWYKERERIFSFIFFHFFRFVSLLCCFFFRLLLTENILFFVSFFFSLNLMIFKIFNQMRKIFIKRVHSFLQIYIPAKSCLLFFKSLYPLLMISVLHTNQNLIIFAPFLSSSLFLSFSFSFFLLSLVSISFTFLLLLSSFLFFPPQ